MHLPYVTCRNHMNVRRARVNNAHADKSKSRAPENDWATKDTEREEEKKSVQVPPSLGPSKREHRTQTQAGVTAFHEGPVQSVVFNPSHPSG